MSDANSNDAEAVTKFLRKQRDGLKALADNPRDRLVRAIEGRNPAGHTEVFAWDVLAVALLVADADHTPRTRDLMAAAAKNLRGAATTEHPDGAPLPDGRAREFVFAPVTGVIAELVEKVK